MSYGLNSLNGGDIGDYIGKHIIPVIKEFRLWVI